MTGDSGLVEAACSIIPDEIRSRQGDTAEGLVQRLSESKFYEEMHALKGGGREGKKRVNLNDTEYGQPRRRSWSVVIKDVHVDANGTPVRTMYKYGRENSRIRCKSNAAPMPKAVFELGARCFMAVRHMLADVCDSSPPNHCQALGYYGLFDPKMGLHKDDHRLDDFRSFQVKCQLARNRGQPLDASTYADCLEAEARKSKGAMLPGSDVMIFSVGTMSMTLDFFFPPKGRPYTKRDNYVTHVIYKCPMGNGYLTVFKAVDDFNFYHMVLPVVYAQLHQYRIAFVFRWLGVQQVKDFPVNARVILRSGAEANYKKREM